MFDAQSLDERKTIAGILFLMGIYSFHVSCDAIILGEKRPKIEDLAGILQRYAKPDIKDKEVEIAWQSFADEWRQKNNLS